MATAQRPQSAPMHKTQSPTLQVLLEEQQNALRASDAAFTEYKLHPAPPSSRCADLNPCRQPLSSIRSAYGINNGPHRDILESLRSRPRRVDDVSVVGKDVESAVHRNNEILMELVETQKEVQDRLIRMEGYLKDGNTEKESGHKVSVGVQTTSAQLTHTHSRNVINLTDAQPDVLSADLDASVSRFMPTDDQTPFEAIFDLSTRLDDISGLVQSFCQWVCHATNATGARVFMVSDAAGFPKSGFVKHVATTGSIVNIVGTKNVQGDMKYCPIADGQDESVLCVPLRMDEEVVGVVKVTNKVSAQGNDRGFLLSDTSKLVQLCSVFTPLYRAASERSALQEEVCSLRNIVAHIEKLSTVSLDHNDVWEEVHRSGEMLASAECFRMYMVDAQCGQFVLEDGAVEPLSFGSGIAGIAAMSNKKINIPNAWADHRFNKGADEGKPRTHQLLCIPISHRGEVKGVLEVRNKIGNEPFTERDERLLQLFGQFAVSVLHMQHNMALLESSRQKGQVMLSVCQQLAAVTLDFDVLRREIIEQARRLVNAETSSLFFVRKGRQELEASGHGPRNHICAIQTGLVGCAAVSGVTLNIADVKSDARYNEEVDNICGNTQSMLVIPLMYEGQVVAVAQLGNKLDGKGQVIRFSKEDEELVETFVAFASLAIRISDQCNVAIKERAKSTAMLEAVAKLVDMDIRDDLSKYWDTIMNLSKRLLAADRGTLYIVDREKGELYSSVTDGNMQIRIPLTQGIAGEVARTGETLNIPDAYNDPRFNTEIDKNHGYVTRSMITAPVIYGGDVLAVMQLINKDSGLASFSDEDEATLKYFSNLAAVTIKNAQLYGFSRSNQAELSSMLNLIGGEPGERKLRRIPSQVRSFKMCGNKTSVRVTSVELAALKEFSFDVFEYKQQGPAGVLKLVQLVIGMFTDLQLDTKFSIDHTILQNFLVALCKRYRDIPYHNVFHAFDVTQTIYAVLKHIPEDQFTYMEKLVLLLCGMCHDVDHMGLNNSFHYKAETPLGLLSNATGSTSPLEVHHCNVTFSLLQSSQYNFLSGIPRGEQTHFYKLMVSCILGTDMARHKELLGGFRKLKEHYDPKNEQQRLLAMVMLLKVADISNPAKPFDTCRRWASAITNEFYMQGDKEAMFIGEIDNPLFDRTKGQEMASNQIWFINSIAEPFYSVVIAFWPQLTPYFYEQVRENKATWEEILEQQRTKRPSGSRREGA